MELSKHGAKELEARHKLAVRCAGKGDIPMNAHQTAKTTLLSTLSVLVLLSIVVGTSRGHAAQAETTKPSQPANAVSPAPTTPTPKPNETGTRPVSAGTQDQKAGGATSVALPRWSVEQGIKAFRWVFGFMTGSLILIAGLLTFALVNVSWKGKWSLGDAVSEESSVQPPPAEIHGRADVILLGSASRLIALVGLLAAVPIVIGVGYAIAWNLIVNGSCPDLTGVRAFLIGLSLTFAPYLANQVRSIFDPRVGTSQAPTTTGQVPVQPAPPVTQGQGTIPSPRPIPQPSPIPGPTPQQSTATAGVQVSGAPRIPVTDIGHVRVLSPHLARLKRHGFRTTHQLVGIARAAEGALAEFLNLNQEELRGLLREIPHYAELSAAYGRRQPNFPMGARPARIPRRFSGSGGSGLPGPHPPTVDLISQMPPVRDQGLARQTCVAFAALATLEHYLSLQNSYVGLSEQFLYWDCKQNDGIANTPGTQLGLAMGLLERDGCCTDSTWQYNTSQMPGNEGEGPPPVAAMAQAGNHRIGYYNLVIPSEVLPDPIDAIRSELARGRCVAFTIPIFQSSLNENVRQTGNFIDPLGTPSDLKIEDHSMCFVGYQDDASNPALGGGEFYVRNSWDQWGAQSQLGIGYGTISYSYIASWCTEAYSIN